MKKGGVEVLKREEDRGEEDRREAHKRRRMEEVEKDVSEIRFAIKELSLLRTDGEQKCGISTVAFLSISNLLPLVLDKIGPTMAVLRQDVQRNIERLEDFYVSSPSLYPTLVDILKKDVEDGTTRKLNSCSKAVVWLTRSIDFSVILLERLMKDPELSLEQAVKEAYDNSFKPWHGWISSAAYKVALKLLPDRKTFTDLLMDKKQNCNLLNKDIQNLLGLLQPLLCEIYNDLKTFNLDRLKSN